MNETDFHAQADGLLSSIEDDMEEADQDGRLEVDRSAGVLTISLNDGRQFVISKHVPMRQVWVSSPVSGAHHFSFDGQSLQWALENGTELRSLLDGEISNAISNKA